MINRERSGGDREGGRWETDDGQAAPGRRLGCRVVARGWHPGTVEHKSRMRASLPGVLQQWLRAGDRLLSAEAGWPTGPPASASEAWSVMVYLVAGASGAVGRFSQVSRYADPVDPDDVAQCAGWAGEQIARLAAAVLLECSGHVDVQRVLSEADGFVDEIADEDDGLVHAAGAIGSLLQARLVCLEEQLQLPNDELADAATAILAPLLAQYACVLIA
jgi:hypothetical protein